MSKNEMRIDIHHPFDIKFVVIFFQIYLRTKFSDMWVFEKNKLCVVIFFAKCFSQILIKTN